MPSSTKPSTPSRVSPLAFLPLAVASLVLLLRPESTLGSVLVLVALAGAGVAAGWSVGVQRRHARAAAAASAPGTGA
ncbi:hypothetical protein CLV92_113107 [Kineococcus xinjiangensis]|uniref:Uncharacterized protein n=1 Tax=Kineococcus xinjiangensis TaxID=512762 RepID=A0A2S6IEN1_9ACTN|nr:hypothetical protein [Kineococcus xinjiangensis]PPK92678.1 hypothetical protein CLV92_113107 [Kineococcus xinjiangensis]